MSPTRLLSGLSSLALVVLGLVALLPDCASACSCVPPPPVERSLAQSSAVFAGEVVDLKRGVGTFYGTPRIEVYKVSFRVSEVWKGPERETLEVSTAREGTTCDYHFSEGREYLVYADGKKMVVASCGRTTPLSKASADLEVLGNGETLGGSGAVLYDTSGGLPPLEVIGTVGGAVAAVSLVVLMRVVRTG